MTDSHLINTIKMLEKNIEIMENHYINSGYKALDCLNGDMACFTVESELFTLEEDGLDIEEEYPIYTNLVNESCRRCLNII